MAVKYIFDFTGIHPFHFKGTALRNVLIYVILFGLWSALIVYISVHVIDAEVSSVLITATGGFLSLMLGFRTNTAYDRFWEGRKLWSNLTGLVREYCINIWLDYKSPNEAAYKTKKDVVNLMLAFTIVAKHNLREEEELITSDIKQLIGSLPNFDTLPNSVYSSEAFVEQNSKLVKRQIDKKTSKLPLQMLYYLISINNDQLSKGLVGAGTHSKLLQIIEEIVGAYTGMERILYTPIPLAYTVHLRQAAFIFCVILPLEMLSYMNKRHWLTVPFVMISVFVIYGILAIGEEIENPFGYDPNDLPIDEYISKLDIELQSITKLKESWEDIMNSSSEKASTKAEDLNKPIRSSTDTLNNGYQIIVGDEFKKGSSENTRENSLQERVAKGVENVIENQREFMRSPTPSARLNLNNSQTLNMDPCDLPLPRSPLSPRSPLPPQDKKNNSISPSSTLYHTSADDSE